jgi:small-conductance mechanosensitive channel
MRLDPSSPSPSACGQHHFTVRAEGSLFLDDLRARWPPAPLRALPRCERRSRFTRWRAGVVRTLGVPLLLLVTGPSGGAQSPDPAHPLATRDTAALVLHGRVIAVFRSSLGANSPSERAAAARQRFESATRSAVPESAAVRPSAAGLVVTAGGSGLFVLTPADADSSSGEALSEVAARAATQVAGVLALERESRSLPLLLRAAAIAVLVTLVALLVLRLLYIGRLALLRRLPGVASSTLGDVAIRGYTLLRGEQLVATLRRLIGLFAWVIGLFTAYLWLTFVLTSFAYSRPWGEALGAYLRDTVRTLALGALAAIPGLFTVVIIMWVTRGLSRLVRGFFDAVEARTVEAPWVHPETANATRRIVVALLWLFAVVVAYPYLPGSSSNVFKGVSVFAGLVLSLGSSGVMNQAMSGLVLMYSRALTPGDYVRIGDTEGVVTELGMLSTKIRTTKREIVTLPNAVVAGTNVKNYTRLADEGEGVLLYTSVTIGYDTPWRQVQGLLLNAADRTNGLRREPAPFVLQTALSDYYIEYQLNAPLEDPRQRLAVLSELHANIVDLFNEFGVQILSPHYVADPTSPAVVPRERWRLSPAERAEPSPPA